MCFLLVRAVSSAPLHVRAATTCPSHPTLDHAWCLSLTAHSSGNLPGSAGTESTRGAEAGPEGSPTCDWKLDRVRTRASDGKVQQRAPHPCVTHPCGQRVPQVEEELGRGEVAEHGACRGTRTERWGLTAAAPTPIPPQSQPQSQPH